MNICVSIIIRARNEAESLRQTLKIISQQHMDFDHEIIIVDNNSTDDTPVVAKDYNCKIVNLKKFSWGRGINEGIKHSKGDFCILLSAHCYPANNKWANTLVTPLINNKNIAATYGRQIPIKGLNPFEEVELKFWFPSKPTSSFAISNANACIRKKVWASFKFNELLNLCEDAEWSMRVRNAGYTLQYVPEAIVYHSHELDILKMFKREYWRSREFVKVCSLNTKKMGISFVTHFPLPHLFIGCYAVFRCLRWFFRDLVYFFEEKYSKELWKAFFYEFIRAYVFFKGACDGFSDIKKANIVYEFMYNNIEFPFLEKFKFIENRI